MSWNASLEKEKGVLCRIYCLHVKGRSFSFSLAAVTQTSLPPPLCNYACIPVAGMSVHTRLWFPSHLYPCIMFTCPVPFSQVIRKLKCTLHVCAKMDRNSFFVKQVCSSITDCNKLVINLIHNLSNNTYLIVWLIMNASSQ